MTAGEVPSWIQVLQALLTPVIALSVAVIGFLQWRTEHHRAMLDLFDRRMSVYQSVRDAVGIVNGNGHGSEAADRLLLEAIGKAQYLFGADVNRYLMQMWHNLSYLSVVHSEVEALEPGAEKEAAIRKRHELFKKITLFYLDEDKVFGPYMRMDQKRVRTPAEWFADRNALRKSFDDQK